MKNNTNETSTPDDQKVSGVERHGYGLGDLASNLYFQMFNMFLLYYYTDVFGLAAGVVANIFLFSRIFDAINDPLMGIVADRTRTRWGSFRPYILWCAVPFGVSGYLMFYSPDLTANAKIVYAVVTYVICGMAYTAVNIPYSGLMATISKSASERAKVSATRFIYAFLGGFVIVQFLPSLKDAFGGGDEVLGFRNTMGFFAIVATILFVITFLTTKERVKPDVKKQSRADILSSLKILFTERPYLVLVVAGLLNLTAVAIKNGSNIYYFKYITGNANEVASFGSGGWIAMILGVMFTGVLIKFFEKRQLIIWLTIIGGIGMAAPFWVDPALHIVNPGLSTGSFSVFGLQLTNIEFIPENARWIYVINLVGSFAAGPPVALVWSMYTDVASYIDWKHKRRIAGLVVSAAVFSQKFGQAIGGWFAATLLAACGFQANQDQGEEAKLAILLLFSIVPAVLIVVQGALIFFYPLDSKMLHKIESDLAERDE